MAIEKNTIVYVQELWNPISEEDVVQPNIWSTAKYPVSNYVYDPAYPYYAFVSVIIPSGPVTNGKSRLTYRVYRSDIRNYMSGEGSKKIVYFTDFLNIKH